MGYNRNCRGESENRGRSVRTVLWVVLVLNLGVAGAKLLFGYWSGSVGMQADGFHSLFDGTSNVVGLVGMVLASRPADRKHPYGHAKYETISSVVIGAMLALAAWKIGNQAFVQLVRGGAAPRVGVGSFVVVLVTIGVNVATTLYERRAGRRLRSEILLADASHTASDVLVSVGVLVGLSGVRLGYPSADSIVALAVSVAIAWTAWKVFLQADETLADRARLPVADVCAVAFRIEGVLGCHSVRTRGAASEVCVDLHVQVNPSLTVEVGHAVAEAVEKAVCDAFPEVADVIVHLEPLDEYQERKTLGEQGEAAPE